jgi:hypothetical protein
LFAVVNPLLLDHGKEKVFFPVKPDHEKENPCPVSDQITRRKILVTRIGPDHEKEILVTRIGPDHEKENPCDPYRIATRSLALSIILVGYL